MVVNYNSFLSVFNKNNLVCNFYEALKLGYKYKLRKLFVLLSKTYLFHKWKDFCAYNQLLLLTDKQTLYTHLFCQCVVPKLYLKICTIHPAFVGIRILDSNWYFLVYKALKHCRPVKIMNCSMFSHLYLINRFFIMYCRVGHKNNT